VTNDLLGLFVVIPLVTSLATVALVRRPVPQRVLGLASLCSMLVLALTWLVRIRHGEVMVSQMGAWPAPFGITLVFDSLSGLLLCAGLLVATACYIHGLQFRIIPSIMR